MEGELQVSLCEEATQGDSEKASDQVPSSMISPIHNYLMTVFYLF